MAKKQKVSLYLETDMYLRLRELVADIPGMSISGVVNELLGDFLPHMEQLLSLVKEGDRDAQSEMLQRLLADQVLNLAGEGMAALRHFDEKAEEGDSSR